MSRFRKASSLDGRPNFKHDPLDLNSNEIRLIRVLHTYQGDARTVRCEIRHVKLTPDLKFWTLSYMWGSSDRPWKILLNDATYHAGHNLLKFLETAQLDQEIRDEWIWVDQICIDQHNVRERNHQVARMADIYRMSSRTILWLGPGFNSLGDWFYPTLIMNQYWTRLWIIQEVLLSRELQLVFSDRKLWWHDVEFLGRPAAACMFPTEIEQFWERLMHGGHWKDHISVLAQAKTTRVGAAVEITSWRKAIEFSKQSGCADERDRIFGLLGLVTETIKIAPDYTKNANQVLLDVLLAEIEATGPSIHELLEFNETLAGILGLPTGLPEEVLLVAFSLGWRGGPCLTTTERDKVVEEVRSDIRNDMEKYRSKHHDLKGLPEGFLEGFLGKWVTYKAIYCGLGYPTQFWFDTIRILNDLARYKAHERLEIPGWGRISRYNRKGRGKKAVLVPFFSAGFILDALIKYRGVKKDTKQHREDEW